MTAASCSALAAIPDGASTAAFGGGGQGTVFLTASAPWCLGVETSGHIVAAADPLTGDGVHHAWETATDSSTDRALVLDDGSTALVYRLHGESLQQLRAAAGGPLEFPVGPTATGGHGVACNDQNGGVLIVGSTARERSDGRVDVLWSAVGLVNDAGVAQLDQPEVRFSALAADDTRVAQAKTSHCWNAPHQAQAVH